jgi:hypothetical protein
MKPATEYSLPERVVGGLWEKMVMHNRLPIISRLMPYRSPYEHYQDRELYGRRVGLWQQPYKTFAQAPMRQMIASRQVGASALRGYYTGTAFTGNPAIGMALGGLAGAGAAVKKLWPNKRWIPREHKRKRKIESTFDLLKYIKGKRAYEFTKDPKYKQMMQKTFRGATRAGDLISATPYAEKPYMIPFMEETDPAEREKIANIMPDDVKKALGVAWNASDFGSKIHAPVGVSGEQMVPPPEWRGWDESIQLDDIKYKVVKREGFNAREFGIGYGDQLSRIARSPTIPGLADFSSPVKNLNVERNLPAAGIKTSVVNFLKSVGADGFVTVTPNNAPMNMVFIEG